MALFNRVAEVIVGQSGGKGVSIKELRIVFDIEKTATETLNKSNVKIYNLSRTTRALVETPNNALILKTGYADDIGPITIFVGIVRRALTYREGADWVTELEMDDGLIAYRDTKFSVSFSPGVQAKNALLSVAGQFGLPVRPLPDDIQNKSYPEGFSFVGKTREAMTKICNFIDCEWSIQNQEIQILKKGGHSKQSAIFLSASTGMLGSPELENKTMGEKKAAKEGLTTNQKGVVVKSEKASEKEGKVTKRLEVQGYKVMSLLQPTIQPGSLVKLKSEGIDNQFFKCEKLQHKGDTHGSEWISELHLRFV